MKSFFYFLLEMAEAALVAAIAVFIVRYFLVQPFLVSGASMEPNFSSGNYLLVDEITYRFREPQRGEVAVFHYPGNESVYYIKRIIGLPSEKIIIKEGRMTIFNENRPEGFVLEEKYLPSGVLISDDKEFAMKENEYFVLGDNRNFSFDSRSWGALGKDEIIGIVRFRLWPINRAMAIEQPAY